MSPHPYEPASQPIPDVPNAQGVGQGPGEPIPPAGPPAPLPGVADATGADRAGDTPATTNGQIGPPADAPSASPPRQCPSVGRIVLYRPPGGCAKPGQTYPAVITHVHSKAEDNVNLAVLNDGSWALQDALLNPTSVSRGESHQPGCWWWPPRM